MTTTETTNADRLLDLLEAAEGPMSPKEIAEASGVDYDVTRQVLGDLVKEKRAFRPHRGLYQIVSHNRMGEGEAAEGQEGGRYPDAGESPTQSFREPSDSFARNARVTMRPLPSAHTVQKEGLHLLSSEQLRRMGLARIQQLTVSAGDGRELDYQLEEWDGAEILPRYYARQMFGVEPERLKKIIISGDSMRGTLDPGDECIAILWEGEPLRDGAIYVIWGPTGAMVKRLRFDRSEDGEHWIWIWSDNPDAGRYRIKLDFFHRDYRVIAWVRRKEEHL